MDHDGPVCGADTGKEGIVQLENSEPMELLEEREYIPERNLGRDRVRSWLSDHFLKSFQHQFACSRPIIIAKISELEVWRCSYSGWKFSWSRLITLLLAINQSPMVNDGTRVHTSYRHRGTLQKKKREVDLRFNRRCTPGSHASICTLICSQTNAAPWF
uniref:Uncharacterized protein n=1 Tax=Oryza barthii TaxID=65489 RepID=A0A0D3F0L6_9ORYZ